MNCEEALAVFASHLDGEELAVGEAAALDGHLAECPSCRAQAKELAATHRDLLVLRAVETARPERTAAATPERIQPATVKVQEPAHRHSRWVEAAAAVVLAAVLALLLWPSIEPTRSGSGTHVAKHPGPRVGQVTASRGRVEGRTASAAMPASLTKDAELVAGQEIRVAQDSFVELNVQDGIRIRLEAVSVLRLGVPNEAGRVFLVTGKGRFDVTERNAPWRLQTPNATVESSGGVFVVTVEQQGEKQ